MTVGTNVYSIDYEYEIMKHSGPGIASFILAMVIGAFDFVLFIFAGVVEMSTQGGMDEESIIAIVIGLLIFGGLAANLLGIGLGIAGMIQKDRKKVFAALGMTFNAVVIFGIIALVVIGSMAPQ